MRLIDADTVEQTMRQIMDMQDLYLPIHIKQMVIDEMPTVDAEPVRHGHWVTFINSDAVECSVCGRGLFGHKTDNYCYHCGAKMDEE